MEWNLLAAQNLAIIDREIGKHNFAPAEYEIVRRVVYHTADLEYKSLLVFSHYPLKMGAAALSARMPVITDVRMVQAGISHCLEKTFANPVYCLQELSYSFPQKNKKSLALYSLGKRYPEAIFVIGQNQTILTTLLELSETQEINPSLIIATPAGFVRKEVIHNKLKNSRISHIRIDSYKGGIGLSVAIFNGLVDLAWLAYGSQSTNPRKS